ncbi:TPA: hypothetical protein L5D85_000198 [Pseudomonas aeruginosa]|nr:hypothetical protein [Pseudomonas aeruginosa]
MNKALDLLHGLVREVERKTCCHEETHRGGAIWEICDSCGEKWADDEGGKPEFAWPESVEKARAFLATHHAVEQAGGDERATLAHRSEFHQHLKECADEVATWPSYKREALTQPSPAQAEQAEAEAERPEVVARVVHSNPVVLGQCGPLNANDELMTVAQHAASVARWAEMFNRVEQQRDAALARVAELEKQEPVVTVAKVPGEDWNSLDFHRDLQDMQPGTKLYAAPVAQAQQLHDLDKQCRDDVARALGLRPNQERGFAWSYLLASIKSCVKASEDSAQAQHSVPDGAADLCRFLAKLYCELDGLRYSTAKLPAEQIADALIFKWPVLQGARNQLNIKRISEQPYDESKLHSAIAAMLAAAPGKEEV